MLLMHILAFGASLAGASTTALEKRQFQTAVICDASFSWMSNSKQQTPCLVAAYVAGACGTNQYTTIKLSPNNQYARPNSTTANPCTCSWAWYNLLAACTACQDMPGSITTWANWRTECTSLLSDQYYFPPTIALAGGTTIPFYAGTNPEQWTNQQFNTNQAKALNDEGRPDLIPSDQTTSKKSTPVGAIVGGVVGGLAVVGAALAVMVVISLRRKKRSKQVANGFISNDISTSTSPLPRPHDHHRGLSNDSMKSLTSMGYLNTAPTSPSVIMTTYNASESAHHGPSASMNSLPLFPAPSTYSSPSPPPAAHGTPTSDTHNAVTPFPYHHRNPSSSSDKHTRQGSHSHVFVYDDPTLPPPRAQSVDDHEQITAASPPRRRVNPPAYSPPARVSSPLARSEAPSYAEANRGRREGHTRTREKGSIDTQDSLDISVASGPPGPHVRGASQDTFGTPAYGHGTTAGSISTIDEIIDPLEYGMSGMGSGTATMEGLTIMTGDSRLLQFGHQGGPVPNPPNL